MTYEQYLKDFVSDVIKATGMMFEHSNIIVQDSTSVSTSVDNVDEDLSYLSVSINFSPSVAADDFEQEFSVHREAAVKLTAMAYVSQFFHAAELISDGSQNLFGLSLHDSLCISIKKNGDYEYYRKYWSKNEVVHTKTYGKPTTNQVKAFAKNTFLKTAHDDAASDVEGSIERLKAYHDDYVKSNNRLQRIQKLLS